MIDKNKSIVKSKMPVMRDLLNKAKPALAEALPEHLDIDRMLRIAFSAMTKTPKLLECDQNSVLLAIMNSVQLGLEPNTPLDEAYLVPFKNTKRNVIECQFIPGYKGLIKLMRQSGQLASIEARPVYANEKFEIEYGLNPRLVHEPILEGDPGPFRLVYAVARFKEDHAEPQVEIMTKKQIDDIRSRSKAKDRGPWVTDYIEMARKTVIKRISKFLPRSSSLAQAIELDNKVAMGESQHSIVDESVLDAFGVEPDYEVEEEEKHLSESDMAPGDPETHQSVKGRTTEKKKTSKEAVQHAPKPEPDDSLSSTEASEDESPAPANKLNRDELCARYELLLVPKMQEIWEQDEEVFNLIEPLSENNAYQKMPLIKLKLILDEIESKISALSQSSQQKATTTNGRDW